MALVTYLHVCLCPSPIGNSSSGLNVEPSIDNSATVVKSDEKWSPSPWPASPSTCNSSISYVVAGVRSGARPAQITRATVVSTVDQCALECWAHNCTQALYRPQGFHVSEFATQQGVVCYLSFGEYQCSSTNAQVRVSNYSTNRPTLISCVQCESTDSITSTSPQPTAASQADILSSSIPQSAIIENSTIPSVVTNQPSRDIPKEIHTCDGPVSFSVKHGANGNDDFNITFTTVVNSAQACAAECYRHQCDFAMYDPAAFRVSKFHSRPGVPCTLAIGPVQGCDNAQRVNGYATFKTIRIYCVKCDTNSDDKSASPNVTVASPDTTTTAAASFSTTSSFSSTTKITINTTTSTSTATTTIAASTPPPISNRTCHGRLSFELKRPEPVPTKIPNFNDVSQTASALECAELCYARNCVIAGYAPAAEDQPAACLMAFTGRVQCGTQAKSFQYNDTSAVEMHCVQCIEESQLIEDPPEDQSKPAESISTPSANTSEPRGCPGAVTFLATTPIDYVNVTQLVTAKSASQCADRCYAYNCTQALFKSPNVSALEEEPEDGYLCLLSFDATNCSNQNYRVNDTDARNVTLITCVQCGDTLANLTSESRTSSVTGITSVTTEDVRRETATTSPTSNSTPSRLCSFPVSFVSTSLSNTTRNDTNSIRNVTAMSAQGCALECYTHNCISAVFHPEPLENSDGSVGPTCFLFFTGEQCEGKSTSPGEEFDDDTPVRISCVHCPSTAIEGAPSRVTKQPIGEYVSLSSTLNSTSTTSVTKTSIGIGPVSTGEVTSSALTTATGSALESTTSSTGHKGDCNGVISFQVPQGRLTSMPVIVNLPVSSVEECALLCYKDKLCTAADFVQSWTTSSQARCEITYSTLQTCQANLPNVTSYTLPSPERNTARIQCVHCSEVTTRSPLSTSLPIATEFNLDAHFTTQKSASIVANSTDKSTISQQSGLVQSTNNGTSQGSTTATPFSDLMPVPSPFFTSTASTTDRECSSRVIFQVVESSDVTLRNFTEDHRVSSAADCARLCYNTSYCRMAGYLPPPDSVRDGVCLLSNVTGTCSPDLSQVVQVYKTVPFLITCIKCSPCSFTLRSALSPPFPNYTEQTDALNVVDCARNCAHRNCTTAAFSSRATRGNCLLATTANENCDSEPETRVEPSGAIKIDCIRCNS